MSVTRRALTLLSLPSHPVTASTINTHIADQPYLLGV